MDDFVRVSEINFHTMFFHTKLVWEYGYIAGNNGVGTGSVLYTVTGQVNYWNFDMYMRLLCSII
jgi:hypothetical protein